MKEHIVVVECITILVVGHTKKEGEMDLKKVAGENDALAKYAKP